MSEWEWEALAKCLYKPLFYLRFLDDIVGAWSHDISLFENFIKTLNNHHPSIKVKYTIDPHQINFLDTTIFLESINDTQKRLLSKVYFKRTDTHALLHKASYHPKHTSTGIIKSQIICFFRISSKFADFQVSTQTLFKALRLRGYSKRFLRKIKNDTLAALAPTRSSIDVNPPQPPTPGRPPPLDCRSPPCSGSGPTFHVPTPAQFSGDPGMDPVFFQAPDSSLHGDFNRALAAKHGFSLDHGNSSTLSDPVDREGDSTSHCTPTQETGGSQLLPFVSTFSQSITPFHCIIKTNFSIFVARCPSFGQYRLLSAYRKKTQFAVHHSQIFIYQQ